MALLRRGQGLIGALMAVSVLSAAMGVVTLLTEGGDDPQPTSAPRETGPPGTSIAAGGSDRKSLSAVAAAYVAAVNGADETAAKDVMCDSSTPGILYEENAGRGDARAGAAELISDTAGVVSITLTDSKSLTVPLAFEFTDGAWCVQF